MSLESVLGRIRAVDELQVTQLWMAGVVGMMLVFGVVAGVGYVKRKSREK